MEFSNIGETQPKSTNRNLRRVNRLNRRALTADANTSQEAVVRDNKDDTCCDILIGYPVETERCCVDLELANRDYQNAANLDLIGNDSNVRQ